MPKELLIVFVKQPVAGKVKSRLAKTIGDEKALSVYKKLIAKTMQTVRGLYMDKRICYSEKILDNDLFDNNLFQKAVQQGDDLGQKMYHAIDTAINQGYNKVCLIGTDIYELTDEILMQAFISLDHCEIVLGQATDGGYYLIGMKRSFKELFEDIEWGTNQVWQQTIKKIKQKRLTYIKLPELNDIDVIEDIRAEDKDYLLS